MALVWITTIIGVISIGFCLMSIKLLYRYINRYRFDESKYTLLFGFIRLRYIAATYAVFTIVFGVSSTLFMLYITLWWITEIKIGILKGNLIQKLYNAFIVNIGWCLWKILWDLSYLSPFSHLWLCSSRESIHSSHKILFLLLF